MLVCPSQLPQVRARHKAGDSPRALFWSIGTGSSLCWGEAAWAKSTALRILNLAMS
jgi:hypothetical protein